MGQYTEMMIACDLKRETPDDVLLIIDYMAGRISELPSDCMPMLPDHPLFETDRWHHLLTSGSAYFGGVSLCDVVGDAGSYRSITARFTMKNYGSEIEKFIDWITPWIDALDGSFLGYIRGDNTQGPEIPTLIYHPNRLYTPAIPPGIARD